MESGELRASIWPRRLRRDRYTALNVGQIQPTLPALLILAVSSRYAEALEWARQRCAVRHGPIALASESFNFRETDYYAATMGTDLKKQFLVFERPIDPATLAEIKRETNDWEMEYVALGRHAETRPLNLDPGYITPAKLVLASTKDHAHRIYLRDGIYAEVTLAFRQRRWQALEWTYPDYRREDYQLFFTRCREWLLNRRPAEQRIADA
jgi:hypothetical protein